MRKVPSILGVVIVVLTAAGWFVATQILTGEYAYAASALAIGQPVPDFKLKDAEGAEHTLSAHKDALVVLVFTSMHCPWARGAQPDLDALSKAYADKGVVFYGVDSNKDTTAAALKAYAEEKKIAFPILIDAGNAYANTLGAKVTPEIFLVDKAGKLAYHGAFDNRTGPEQAGSEAHLKDALDAVLAGKPVEKPTVKAWGCGINRAN